ncbi:MAG: beta-hydroxyacyl-ACP dehydratase [Desulfobacteraceae bacterium]|nr:MAG: beta-hydroxyacyl-ACP dehydratase [Desulfobacteraceae bacterium]
MRFLLVDKILEMTTGQSIRAEKTIGADEDVFKDHFPGFPVVPGVLLTEMMAQTAGKCLDAEKKHRGKAMLAKINSANFRQWMRPDQVAVISAEIRTNRDQYATAKCKVEVDSTEISSAELFFTFVPNETFAADYRDDVLESFLNDK